MPLPWRSGPSHSGTPRSVRWVAAAPPGTADEQPRQVEPPYTGPPSYPVPPRWGLPQLVWRAPTAVPGTQSARQGPFEALRTSAGFAIAALVLLAGGAFCAAAAQLWRYMLLVQSRDAVLGQTGVVLSDVAVWLTTWGTWLVAVAAVPLAGWWVLVALEAAAEHAGVRPPRSVRDVVIRLAAPWLLPAAVVTGLVILVLSVPSSRTLVTAAGPPLVLAMLVAAGVCTGPVVTELEHMALKRPPGARQRPSRLVLGWWLLWVLNPVLALLTVRAQLADGLQAQADAVALGIWTNVAAAGSAALSAVLVRRISLLISPSVPRMARAFRVVSVRGAPDPPLRAMRPAGARR